MLLEESGYIYILVNPSMEGLVKIGKTTRDPKDRVNELSSATGVPTPFILIYQEFFNNCSTAEIAVHQTMEKYRVSNHREFFRLQPYEAINIIQNMKNGNFVSNKLEINTENNKEKIDQINNLSDIFLNEGIQCYLGKEDFFQDYNEALSLFNKALKLGNINVYKYLGIMWWQGQGCKGKYEKAIEYLKKGANLGDYHCYAIMGIVYFQEKKLNYEDNSDKSWKYFFNSLLSTISETDAIYILEYLITYHNHGLDMYFINEIIPLKHQILKYIEFFNKQFPMESIDEVRIARENLNQYVKAPFKNFNEVSPGDLLFHKKYGTYSFIGKEQLTMNGQPKDYYSLKNYEGKLLFLEPSVNIDMLNLEVPYNNTNFYTSLKSLVDLFVQ